jgi:predicted nucleic acid-binding protein
MKAVLDSSAALQAVLPEAHTAKAIRLLDEYRQGLHEFLAPDIFPIETLNALAKAERRRRIPVGTGLNLWKTVMADPPVFHPHFHLLTAAYAIANSNQVAVYDSLYIALADREGCGFVTADDKLVSNLQGRFPFIIALASLP